MHDTAADVLWVCQRLDARQFVANYDGNVSVRLENGHFLATPTARGKGELARTDLIVVDEKGELVEGNGRIFSEWSIHRAIYRRCPDIQCVVHAHPVSATAWGLQEKPFLVDYLPEAIVSLGLEIPCFPFTLPGSSQQLQMVDMAAPSVGAFLVAGNGVFAHGHDLKTTYFRIELIEHLCRIYLSLSREDRAQLKSLPASVKAECAKKHQQVMEKYAAPFRIQAEPESENDDVDTLVAQVIARLDL